MFQVATLPEHGLNSNLLILFISEAFVKRRKKDFSAFPACIVPDLEYYFSNFKDFKGEFKKTQLIYPAKDTGVQRILLIGLGDEISLSAQDFRELGYTLQGVQETLNTRRNHIYLGNLRVCQNTLIENLSEGIFFKRYAFERYKSNHKPKEKKGRYIYVCSKEHYSPRFRQAFLKTQKVMSGVYLTRNLANLPSNDATPEDIATFVKKHFAQYAHCSVEALDQKKLKKMGMGALLGVAQGSAHPPFLVIIRYEPTNPNGRRIVLVGKGVTFDSGGISIKPSANMEEMKYDMAGAAAVIGGMEYVAHALPKSEIIAVIPLVENMPSGSALKPGDIITSYAGKTIEVINTDAEGRLILADALAYANERFMPNVIIDFATLTGAMVVALGDKRSGLFCNTQNLKNVLIKAGEESGDLLWPMPLDDIYQKELESTIADIKNIGSRWGGAITAAKFLQNFVGKTPWAHIDMAGMANDIKHIDYWGKGATGFGPRLIAAAIKGLQRSV